MNRIAEFTLITNQFSAEYGHSTAGQFIISTKSGTNELHGNAFYFLNNKHLNALDSLTRQAVGRGDLPDKPRFDRNQVGGTLGGPVLKDKFFLFGAYQFTSLGQAAVPGGGDGSPDAGRLRYLGPIGRQRRQRRQPNDGGYLAQQSDARRFGDPDGGHHAG